MLLSSCAQSNPEPTSSPLPSPSPPLTIISTSQIVAATPIQSDTPLKTPTTDPKPTTQPDNLNTPTPQLSTNTPSPPPASSPTPSPSATPLPTPINIPNIWTAIGTPIPLPTKSIAIQNIHQIQELARWQQYGTLLSLGYQTNSDQLWFKTSTGIYEQVASQLGNPLQSTTATVLHKLPPNEQWTTSQDNNGHLQIRNRLDNTLLHTLPDTADHQPIRFTPDNQYLLTHQRNPTQFLGDNLYLWQVSNGQLIHQYDPVYAFTVSPDLSWLAIGIGPDVEIYPFGQTTPVLTIVGRDTDDAPSQVLQLTFSPDSRQLAIGVDAFDYFDNEGGTVSVYTIPDGALQYTIPAQTWLAEEQRFLLSCDERYINHPPQPPKVYPRFSPDGQRLAVHFRAYGYGDEPQLYTAVAIYQANTGQHLYTLPEQGINTFAFSPDGQTITTGSQTGVINVWQVDNGALLQTERIFNGPILEINLSADEQWLAVKKLDGTELRRAQDGRLVRFYPQAIVAFSPAGQTIAVGHADGSIEWQLPATGALNGYFDDYTSPIIDLHFVTGTTVAVATQDCQADIWQLTNATRLNSLEPLLINNDATNIPYQVGLYRFLELNDGLLLADLRGRLGLWTVSDGTLEQIWDPTTHASTATFLTEDTIFIGGSPAMVWSIVDSELKLRKWESVHHILTAALSPDQNLLLVGNNTVYRSDGPQANFALYNSETMDLLRNWSVYEGDVTTAVWGNNNRYFITGSLDGTINWWGVWEPDT
ncbi:MAG TPA: hypothetical protein VLL52_05780 [Anaerolineae bacterium]|nr:hypothetical protein [Anaerolineae bacterium]